MELGDHKDESILVDWRKRCAELQIELDTIRVEMQECEERFERLMLWKEQPRLPVRGLTTLSDKGGEDWK